MAKTSLQKTPRPLSATRLARASRVRLRTLDAVNTDLAIAQDALARASHALGHLAHASELQPPSSIYEMPLKTAIRHAIQARDACSQIAEMHAALAFWLWCERSHQERRAELLATLQYARERKLAA